MPDDKKQQGKPTIDQENHDENVGQRGPQAPGSVAAGGSEREEEKRQAERGQRVTRDDGDNDDQGELK
jgi:hypothetical protein